MEFKRRTWSRYSKLGKRRKKKQVWRRPTGRDNKMRERRKGYPARVEIGYRKGKDRQKEIKIVCTAKDLENVQKGEAVVFGKIGDRKKIELAKLAKEKKMNIENLNIEKFLKNMGKKKEKKKSEKASEKSKSKDKKENSKETKKTEAESKEEKK